MASTDGVRVNVLAIAVPIRMRSVQAATSANGVKQSSPSTSSVQASV